SEIAVGGMDFDHLEASGQGAMRGRSKIIDDLIDFGDGEFFRVGIVWIKRDRAGSNRNPAAIGYCDFVPAEPGRGGAALSAGVGELHAGDGALFADEVGNWFPGIDVRAEIDAGVRGRDAADGLDGGGFGQDQGGSTYGAAAEMNEVPGVGMAVFGRVFAHGGNGNSVF